MLENLLIENFRGFSRLAIDKLGRVNLIVGKNTVGKTTLLEAVWLYASRMRPEAIQELLLGRDEVLADQDPGTLEVEVDLKALFHGRALARGKEAAIVVGPRDNPYEQVTLSLTFVEEELVSESSSSSYAEICEDDIETAEGEVLPALIVTYRGEKQKYPRRFGSWSRSYRRRRMSGTFPPFLRAGDVDNEAIGRWWDAVALRESEERITSCLHLLAPIERVTLVESPRRSSKRIFVVRLRGERSPQPLKSLGDGVERMFRTVLALECARRNLEEPQQPELFAQNSAGEWDRRNILLIDEVEAGIHYTALRDYWGMIFALSRELDLQVFATTHSWDCVQGFQEAAISDQKSEGVLVRLESANGKHRAVTFTERELSIVTRENIEVR